MGNQKLVSLLSAVLLLFSAFATAWPGALEFAHPGALVARQNSGSSGSATQTASQSNTQSAPGSASQSQNDNNSQSVSQTGSGSGSSRPTSATGSGRVTSVSYNKNATKTAIDPRLPPGGISMITPAATDGMTFVKVGNFVTFAWNYTSLSVPPSYIDVVATNTVNHQTYTIAANQSYAPTQSITWDTNQFTQTTDLPFVVATYTLMVYDANSDPTAVPSAGYLAPFLNLQFGIYTPQPYTPLNDFRCATCNGAISSHEKQALSVLLGTCAITILSFTWFASGIFRI